MPTVERDPARAGEEEEGERKADGDDAEDGADEPREGEKESGRARSTPRSATSIAPEGNPAGWRGIHSADDRGRWRSRAPCPPTEECGGAPKPDGDARKGGTRSGSDGAGTGTPSGQTCGPDAVREISLWGRYWGRKVFSYRCSIDVGTGSPPENEPQPAAPAVAPRFSRFTGECYRCGTAGHSQNYCPLRRCECCTEWGHSERVCPQSAAAFARRGDGSGTTDDDRDGDPDGGAGGGGYTVAQHGLGWRRPRTKDAERWEE